MAVTTVYGKPGKVMTNIIAKRIVTKQGAEKIQDKKKIGQRSLTDLMGELEWE